MKAWLWAVLVLAGENRWWSVEVDVRGPLEELRLEVGSAGGTRVPLGLGEGERRRLEVLVPAMVPLGLAGLDAVPLPTSPADSAVAHLGWSREQPAGRLRRLPRGLLARPRPPVVAGASGAPGGAGAAALLAAAWIVVLGLRRRPWLALGAGLLAGTGLAFLAAGAPRSSAGLRLYEGDLGSGAWVRVDAAAGRLTGRFDALEVTPPGTGLELLAAPTSGGADPGGAYEVRAARAGSTLHGLTVLPPGLPGGSGSTTGGPWPVARLARVWTRPASATGEGWTARGAWAAGEPLPPAVAGRPKAPPGWLLAGLPAGTGLLLGQVAGEERCWLRATGLELDE